MSTAPSTLSPDVVVDDEDELSAASSEASPLSLALEMAVAELLALVELLALAPPPPPW